MAFFAAYTQWELVAMEEQILSWSARNHGYPYAETTENRFEDSNHQHDTVWHVFSKESDNVKKVRQLRAWASDIVPLMTPSKSNGTVIMSSGASRQANCAQWVIFLAEMLSRNRAFKPIIKQSQIIEVKVPNRWQGTRENNVHEVFESSGRFSRVRGWLLCGTDEILDDIARGIVMEPEYISREAAAERCFVSLGNVRDSNFEIRKVGNEVADPGPLINFFSI